MFFFSQKSGKKGRISKCLGIPCTNSVQFPPRADVSCRQNESKMVPSTLAYMANQKWGKSSLEFRGDGLVDHIEGQKYTQQMPWAAKDYFYLHLDLKIAASQRKTKIVILLVAMKFFQYSARLLYEGCFSALHVPRKSSRRIVPVDPALGNRAGLQQCLL